jgi:hypothetical protein
MVPKENEETQALGVYLEQLGKNVNEVESKSEIQD